MAGNHPTAHSALYSVQWIGLRSPQTFPLPSSQVQEHHQTKGQHQKLLISSTNLTRKEGR